MRVLDYSLNLARYLRHYKSWLQYPGDCLLPQVTLFYEDSQPIVLDVAVPIRTILHLPYILILNCTFQNPLNEIILAPPISLADGARIPSKPFAIAESPICWGILYLFFPASWVMSARLTPTSLRTLGSVRSSTLFSWKSFVVLHLFVWIIGPNRCKRVWGVRGANQTGCCYRLHRFRNWTAAQLLDLQDRLPLVALFHVEDEVDHVDALDVPATGEVEGHISLGVDIHRGTTVGVEGALHRTAFACFQAVVD